MKIRIITKRGERRRWEQASKEGELASRRLARALAEMGPLYIPVKVDRNGEGGAA